jgi:hypothetical protein
VALRLCQGSAPISFHESAWPPAAGFNKIPTTLQRSPPNLVVTVQPQLAARTPLETTMRPAIMSDVAKHCIADWHRQADRDPTTRATRKKHASHRLSVILAGLATARPALLGWQGAATAASHRPHHHAAQAAVQQTQNGLTFTDLKDLANVKRDLQAMAQQMQRGMTFEDLQDLAKVKRGLFRR